MMQMRSAKENHPHSHDHAVEPAAKKLNKISAIGLCKCPHCRKGNMFMYRPYHLKGFARMHDECPHCGQDFQIEPGFYMLAGYIGYINFVVVICALTFSSFALFPGIPDVAIIASCIGLTLLLVPVNFRLSRSLNMHLMSGVRYNPQAGMDESGFYITPEGKLEVGGPRHEPRKDSR
jgi:uncharacterized protein (DUF983 family)